MMMLAPRVLGLLAPLLCAATPVVVPPPPPRSSAHVQPTSFIVFFEHGSANLTEQARRILAIVPESRQGERRFLIVEGHADTSHAAEQSMAISRRRAWAVRDYLVDRGIPGDHIRVRYHGEERLLIATGDEVREPQNRRVEIHLAATP